MLLFYRRVVNGTCSRLYKAVVWAALIFCVLYTVAFIVTLFTQCRPLEATWERFNPAWGKEYKCIPRETQLMLTQVSAILSVFSDFYAVVLPGILVLQLNLPRRQKIALYAIFGLGFSVVAAGIVRTIFLTKILDGKSFDLSWIGFETFAAAFAETQIGIICACAPSLKSIFARYFKGTLSHLKGPRSLSHDQDSSSERRMQGSSLRRPAAKALSIDSSEIELTNDKISSISSVLDAQLTPSPSSLKTIFKWPKPKIYETTDSDIKMTLGRSLTTADPSVSTAAKNLTQKQRLGQQGTVEPLPGSPTWSEHSFDTFRRWESSFQAQAAPLGDALSHAQLEKDTIYTGRVV